MNIHQNGDLSQAKRPLDELVSLLEQQFPPDLLRISLLAYGSCWVGKQAYVELGWSRVYPNLHVMLVGPEHITRSAIEFTIEFFQDLGDAPLIRSSGMNTAFDLVYALRDSLSRPEKQTTPPYEPAAFSKVCVDIGNSERRLLLTQDLSDLVGNQHKSSRDFARILKHTFMSDQQLIVSLGHRDGGKLTSTDAHVAALCPVGRRWPDKLAKPFASGVITVACEGYGIPPHRI